MKLQHNTPLSLPGNEELRNFVDRLKTKTNVSQYIELPMIAVMGDTSSGKSSLLSSISGVELPSSSELTTRCPIMLHMSRSETMSATVDVILKDNTKDFEKFETLSVTESNWNDLSSQISKAQEYIIKACDKEVSRDLVQVKVTGPQCEDLTLVDLPGIVRSRGLNEGASIVEDIQSLIDEYLCNKRCIILAVVPANVDFHNSQILADAGKVDPETKRTIPVITKPDLIDAGAEADVKDLLLGKKTSKFEMGFHMVKGRGQAALNADESIETSLKKEEAFFGHTDPWKEISNRSLFGTSALRTKLSGLYVELIRSSLPEIINEMNERMENAVTSLSELGDVHTSLQAKRLFMNEIKHDIVKHIKSFLEGKEFQKGSTGYANFHDRCEGFNNSIRTGRLACISRVTVKTKVIVVDNGHDIHGTVVGIAKNGDFFIDYDDRQIRHLPTFCKAYKAVAPMEFDFGTARSPLVNTLNTPTVNNMFSSSNTPTVNNMFSSSNTPTVNNMFGSSSKAAGLREYKKGDGRLSSSNTYYISNGDITYDELLPIPKSSVRRDSGWMTEMINDRRRDDLPIFLDSSVFRSIIATFIAEDWYKPCHDLVNMAKELLLELVESIQLECKQFRRYPQLNQRLTRLMKEQIDIMIKEASKEVDQFIKRESFPYSQDHYLFENLSKKRSASIQEQIYSALALTDTSDVSHSASSIKTILDGIFDRNQRKSVVDHQCEEMVNVLEAYGKVSVKRFVDGIPMICWNQLRSIRDSIETIFLFTTDEDLENMMCDTRYVKLRFEQLSTEVKDLQTGMDTLDALMY